jgi:hypothetical protein
MTAIQSQTAAHHGEVVGDQQQAEPEAAAQVGEQFQDHRLHRDIQRGPRCPRPGPANRSDRPGAPVQRSANAAGGAASWSAPRG